MIFIFLLLVIAIGILKIFVDRTSTWYYRHVLQGKSVLSVSTTKGSGLKYTLRYLEGIDVQWGMMSSRILGRSIINIHKPINPCECRLFIKNIRLNKISYMSQASRIKYSLIILRIYLTESESMTVH